MLALDYGSARTGVAVSDRDRHAGATAHRRRACRPAAGLRRLAELVAEEAVERVVVGLPLTLRGERGAPGAGDRALPGGAPGAVDVPVESFDERFTTTLAAGARRRRAEDARAAAHLLESYLAWTANRG